VPARFAVGICIIAWIGCSRREEGGAPPAAAPSAAAPTGAFPVDTSPAGATPADPAPDSSADSSTNGPLPVPRAGDAAKAEKLVARAKELDGSGAAELALAGANQALAADPACVAALLLRAKIRMREGELYDPTGALVDARLASRIAPDDPEAIASEGFARHMNGDAAGARTLLERYLALPPQPGRTKARAAAEEALGFIELRHGRLDPAQGHFDAAQKLAPGRATLAYGLAMVCDARGDAAGKEHWLDESLKRDPHSLQARNARLALLVRQKKRVEAEREKRALELLRRLKDDSSESFAKDHAGKAKLWGELAEALPGDTQSRIKRLRELTLAGELATVAKEGNALIATGAVDGEAVMLTASAFARLGRADEARVAVAAFERCEPPLTPQERTAARDEIERQIAAAAAAKKPDPDGKKQ
jgi:Flp pilus assembly protein TadD